MICVNHPVPQRFPKFLSDVQVANGNFVRNLKCIQIEAPLPSEIRKPLYSGLNPLSCINGLFFFFFNILGRQIFLMQVIIPFLSINWQLISIHFFCLSVCVPLSTYLKNVGLAGGEGGNSSQSNPSICPGTSKECGYVGLKAYSSSVPSGYSIFIESERDPCFQPNDSQRELTVFSGESKAVPFGNPEGGNLK